MISKNGVVLYRGPSMLDGQPIVVIGVITKEGKANGKTGALVQTYILVDNVDPRVAIQTGQDATICGDCVHRGDKAEGKGRTCYVNIGQGVLIVFKAYMRGIYAVAADGAARTAFGRGRKVRLGTYGDPAAVPAYVWQQLLAGAIGQTAYTHQWRRAPHLRLVAMASVDSAAEDSEAQALGWRTFWVKAPGDDSKRKDQARCPASAEAGKKLTCSDCMACNGTGTGRRGSVVIQAHGGTATMANVRRRFRFPVVVERLAA